MHSARGQSRIEIYVTRANYLGITINASHEIYLSKDHHQKLLPTVGIGLKVPDKFTSTKFLFFDLNYEYMNWGCGLELTRFIDERNSNMEGYNDCSEILLFPNLNYTLNITSNLYIQTSCGAYFSFSKKQLSDAGVYKFKFDGNVIPGIGVSIGYKIKNRN